MCLSRHKALRDLGSLDLLECSTVRQAVSECMSDESARKRANKQWRTQ